MGVSLDSKLLGSHSRRFLICHGVFLHGVSVGRSLLAAGVDGMREVSRMDGEAGFSSQQRPSPRMLSTSSSYSQTQLVNGIACE